jgi:hypothetical protein
LPEVTGVGEFKDIVPAEPMRTYIYPNGAVSFKMVNRVCVRPSGTHRLETLDGKKHIVQAGWLAITFEADHWSF